MPTHFCFGEVKITNWLDHESCYSLSLLKFSKFLERQKDHNSIADLWPLHYCLLVLSPSRWRRLCQGRLPLPWCGPSSVLLMTLPLFYTFSLITEKPQVTSFTELLSVDNKKSVCTRMREREREREKEREKGKLQGYWNMNIFPLAVTVSRKWTQKGAYTFWSIFEYLEVRQFIYDRQKLYFIAVTSTHSHVDLTQRLQTILEIVPY
jgi:hypothetical protein